MAMRREYEPLDNLSGSLLLAHPSLRDPNFRRSVVLISAHSEEDGAIGVVINKPLNKTLGEVDERFAEGPLAQVPLYAGGPVCPDQMLLAAWNWAEEEGTFRFFFGLDADNARELIETNPDAQIRGFLGYSGWGEGQLEGELEQDAWVTTVLDGDTLGESNHEGIWRAILGRVQPDLLFLADAHEDPSQN
ncbi:MAG: YqgE/AlgH family protein [Opitutales bacterium]